MNENGDGAVALTVEKQKQPDLDLISSIQASIESYVRVMEVMNDGLEPIPGSEPLLNKFDSVVCDIGSEQYLELVKGYKHNSEKNLKIANEFAIAAYNLSDGKSDLVCMVNEYIS